MNNIKIFINKIFQIFGYQISKIQNISSKDTDTKTSLSFPIDFDKEYREIILKARPYTMTSIERMYAFGSICGIYYPKPDFGRFC
jgi:hypothetical protein